MSKEDTSKRAAWAAAQALRSPNSNKAAKTAAGSALSQTKSSDKIIRLRVGAAVVEAQRHPRDAAARR